MGKIFEEANMDGFMEVEWGFDFLNHIACIGDNVLLPSKDSYIFGKVVKIYKYNGDYDTDSYYTYFIRTNKNKELIKREYSIITIIL